MVCSTTSSFHHSVRLCSPSGGVCFTTRLSRVLFTATAIFFSHFSVLAEQPGFDSDLYSAIEEFTSWTEDPGTEKCERVKFRVPYPVDESSTTASSGQEKHQGASATKNPDYVTVSLADVMSTIEDHVRDRTKGPRKTSDQDQNALLLEEDEKIKKVSYLRRYRGFKNLRAITDAMFSKEANKQKSLLVVKTSKSSDNIKQNGIIGDSQVMISSLHFDLILLRKSLATAMAEAKTKNFGKHFGVASTSSGDEQAGGSENSFQSRVISTSKDDNLALALFEKAVLEDEGKIEFLTKNEERLAEVDDRRTTTVLSGDYIDSAVDHDSSAQDMIVLETKPTTDEKNKSTEWYHWFDDQTSPFPSAKANSVFQMQMLELQLTTMNSKKEELAWAWEAVVLTLIAKADAVSNGSRGVGETSDALSELKRLEEEVLHPVVPNGRAQDGKIDAPNRSSSTFRAFARHLEAIHPYFNALDRAEQNTLLQIRTNLKYKFPQGYEINPLGKRTSGRGMEEGRDNEGTTVSEPRRASSLLLPAPTPGTDLVLGNTLYPYHDRQRHTFRDFTDRLEMHKVRDNSLYKYVSMDAMHPYFLVIEGILFGNKEKKGTSQDDEKQNQSWQRRIAADCFPFVLLLGNLYNFDQFLANNGDIWQPIYQAQRKFVEIQQNIQKFDVLAQVLQLRLDGEHSEEDGAERTTTLAALTPYDHAIRNQCFASEHTLRRIKQKTKTAFQSMYESQSAGNEMFALEMSHNRTAEFRKGNLTKQQRMDNYKSVLYEINELFTNELQLEWAPKGGTLMAFLRYAANSFDVRNSVNSLGETIVNGEDDHFDLENDDIDLFIGAESETHSQHIMLEITERLKRSPFGTFHCFGKSVVHDANFTWRNDLLFCMRKEPVLMLLDIGSYLKVGNLAVAHRLCEDASQFTDHPRNCEVRNELVFQDNSLTLDEIYPSELCLAWNMTLPCPVPEKALKAVMIGGDTGEDAGCPYLPTKERLANWREEDWTRLLDSMEWIESHNEVGGDTSETSMTNSDSDGETARQKPPHVLSIKPYIYDDPECRKIVYKYAKNYERVLERIESCCKNVQRSIRKNRYRYFTEEVPRVGPSSTTTSTRNKGKINRVYTAPYDFLKHGKSKSGAIEWREESTVLELFGDVASPNEVDLDLQAGGDGGEKLGAEPVENVLRSSGATTENRFHEADDEERAFLLEEEEL
ncbi:unnamed protein product [Amoebophrya sp. A120]|nr:unnamed protein product [Amoebophrya sp. A120]|eukprot:GSA120T00010181001.1